MTKKIILYLSSIPIIWSLSGAEPLSSASKPEFIEVFSQHQKWEGYYMYNETQNICSLYINSQHYSDEHVVLATLKDWIGAIVEMEGRQDGSNELAVIFNVHVMFKHVDRFPQNFTFRSKLYEKHDRWYMSADVTVPENGLFGEMTLHQGDGVIGPWFEGKPEAWRYFLIIGLPLIIGIAGVIMLVWMIYWGIKKGYIRHVPKAYKTFNNPVQYNSEEQQVHI